MARHHEDDVAFIEALARLLRENDLSEIEVSREEGDERELTVRLARHAAPAPPQYAYAPAPAPAAAHPGPAPAAAPEDPAQHPGAVTALMVGTVYLAPEPGAPAFVKTGDQVKEGQTLLIIEAMKTMNQIASPRAGTVRRIMVDDGQAVEYGAPLVIVE